MDKFEYRVVPAPTKGKRGKWVRGAATRFADRLEQIFNDMGEDGWEYVRTDTLPNEERKGLSHVTVTYRNLLVFRKIIPDPELEAARQLLMENKIAKPVALLVAPDAAETNRIASNPADIQGSARDLGEIEDSAAFEGDLQDAPSFDPDDVEDAEELIDADNLTSLPENLTDDTAPLDDLKVAETDPNTSAGPINVALRARSKKADDGAA